MTQASFEPGPTTFAEWDHPRLPLVNEDGVKIKLQLRRMSFDREIANAFPVEMLAVHQILIEERGRRNASIYMMVSAWNKLKVHERYWESFKFNNEPDYLTYYGLPDGMTLAGWTIMVRLFDKATFVLLGDEVLSFLMRLVGTHQSDTDERKHDYQAIFDRYCKHHDYFDKDDFYTIIRQYIKEKYQPVTVQIQRDGKNRNKPVIHAKPAETHDTRTTKTRIIQPIVKEQKFGPTLEHDFAWKEHRCPVCVEKIIIIADQKKYIERLEAIIRAKVGEAALPPRPKSIRDI